MQFNSYELILFFLPAAVLLYFLANRIRPAAGKLVLIAASLLFYGWGRWNMLLYLGGSILLNYLFVLLITKRQLYSRWSLAFPVALNVCLLLYFKYLDFAVSNVNLLLGTDFALSAVVLPLGISFFTFQQIAYLVAVWRRELDCSLPDYLVYILYFPKLLMGPLAEPADFITQLNQPERKKPDLNNIAAGVKLFSLGLLKKVLIADTFAKAVSWARLNMQAATSADCLLLMLCYTFEIYFDFSGYSDMATGISALFNIDLPINFDSPYKALSIREFWRRWHISLTRFFTKYIYIPLGGSRKGKAFTYFNTMLVFLVSGLWHGASWSFVIWGLLHGALSCLDRLLDSLERRVWKPLRWLCTFAEVSILWLLFYLGSVRLWLSTLMKIFRLCDFAVSRGMLSAFQPAELQFFAGRLGIGLTSGPAQMICMLLVLLAAGVVCLVPENNYRNRNRLNPGTVFPAAAAFIWGLLCLGTESAFVYFGF